MRSAGWDTPRRRMAAVALLTLLFHSAVGRAGQAAEGVLDVYPAFTTTLAEADAPARSVGAIAKSFVAEGARVEQGQRLAVLDERQARLAVERAELQLKSAALRAAVTTNLTIARKRLEVAKNDLQRASESLAKFAGSISPSEIDRLRLLRDQAALEVENAQHASALARIEAQVGAKNLDSAKTLQSHHEITAPIAGIVTHVHRRAGEWVEPGDKVFRIVSYEQLRVEAFVSASDARSISIGSRVQFSIDDNPSAVAVSPAPTRAEGAVVFISPETDPVNRHVKIWATIDNRSGQLRAGAKGRLSIELGDSTATEKVRP
ncbi:MAG: efflux RND transporter periplasmic adaptor subunit [Pirellulaceae bacterium]|nr:efflux RND transporter periplasmic adaptor subunit [Pirellulaceae bacterium]MDP7017191.1 efflux RND transporter periplasmic adaptor subunit [Pirellulaceae bacterium]